jgi:hypothetical protein
MAGCLAGWEWLWSATEAGGGGQAALPALPPKTYLGKASDAVGAERVVSLKEYVRGLEVRGVFLCLTI